MINYLNLEYFLTVAEELNITKAAKKLYISQQSLSNHISNLEKEFDVLLFDRTTPLTLTYAGQALKSRARKMLYLKEETYREIADIKDFSTGRLSIGVSHTRGRTILPEVLPIYKRQFPGIELHLVEGNSKELDYSLVHGEVDIIIGMLPFMVENIETVPICEEEILAVVPDEILDRTFPGHTKEIKHKLEQNMDLQLLSGCPYLLLNKGNRVRTIVDEIFEDVQMTPDIILETENIETVLSLAAKGMGITFYPKMFLSSQNALHNAIKDNPSLNLYSLNYNRAHGVLAIGYHKGRYLSQATKEFIRIVKETI